MLVLIRKSNGDFVFEDSQSLVTDESGKVSVISAEGGCEPCEKLCEGGNVFLTNNFLLCVHEISTGTYLVSLLITVGRLLKTQI